MGVRKPWGFFLTSAYWNLEKTELKHVIALTKPTDASISSGARLN
jgi:hypothetical protein